MYTPIEYQSRSFGNNRWIGVSPLLKRRVWSYSDLEFEDMVLLEFNANVVAYCEQPDVTMTVDGRQTFPDRWILWRDGQEEFREVKFSDAINPESPTVDERSIRQIETQQEWCRLHNYIHTVQTEKEIRKNIIFLENLKTLLPYLRRHGQPTVRLMDRVRDCLGKTPVLLAQLYQELPDLPRSDVIEALAWIYKSGAIATNFDVELICFKTEVTLSDEAQIVSGSVHPTRTSGL